MTPHQKIIERFVSPQVLADTLSMIMGRPVAKITVQGWRDGGYFPSRYHSHILAAGAVLDPPLTTGEFFKAQADRAGGGPL